LWNGVRVLGEEIVTHPSLTRAQKYASRMALEVRGKS